MLKFIQTGGKTDGTGDKIVRTFTPSQLKAVIIRLRKYPFIRLLGRPSLLMLVSNVRSFIIQKSLIVFFLFTWAIIPLLSRILMVMLSRKRKKMKTLSRPITRLRKDLRIARASLPTSTVKNFLWDLPIYFNVDRFLSCLRVYDYVT